MASISLTSTRTTTSRTSTRPRRRLRQRSSCASASSCRKSRSSSCSDSTRGGARFARESAAGRIGTGMLLGMIGLALALVVESLRQRALRVGPPCDIPRSATWVGGHELLLARVRLSLHLARDPDRDGARRRHAGVLVGARSAGVHRSRAALRVRLSVPRSGPCTGSKIRRSLPTRANWPRRRVEEIPVRVQTVSDVTSAPNAGASGIGPSRRVILWDTLLTGPFERDEIRFVLAHEFAHHSRSHLHKFLGWYAPWRSPASSLSRASHAGAAACTSRAIPLALFVVVVLQLLALPVLNTIGRHAEAKRTGSRSRRHTTPTERVLFRHFTTDGLADPTPPGWSYLTSWTHPPSPSGSRWRTRGKRAGRRSS